jgi:D-lactate dehydrogenase (cytochrome)
MSDIAAAITEIKALLGERMHTSQSMRDLHGQNEAHFDHMPPDAVAFPHNTQEVSDIVKACAKHKCPIIPWGVGTSLEAHALPVRGGITIDMSEMNQVLEILDQDLLAVVQPGLTREGLNTELRTTGLFFPIDPGANATLGGMTATRASGTTAVRYGTMKENVLAMEVVMPDGRIIRTGTRAKKSSAGYDLTKLFVGSEGTLGIITELTLRLQGQPECIAAAVCDFPSIEDAVNVVITAVQLGIPMARMELIDETTIRAINAYSNFDYPEVPHLFMEFHGSEIGVKDQSDSIHDIVKDHHGGDFQWSTNTEDRNRLWAARHQTYYATKALFPGQLGLTTDICVPISHLADAIRDTQRDLLVNGVTAGIVGHVGDGNYHALMFSDPAKPEQLERNKALAHRMAERALKINGTVTGEHGVGLGKMKYMAAEHGEALSLMVDIKRVFDPQNIMNPGKMIPMN